MARFVRVSNQEALASGRLDPAFHIMAQRLAPEVEKLKTNMTTGQAQESAHTLFGLMPSDITRESLKDLQRGQAGLPGLREVERAIRDYPFLALAALAEVAPSAFQRLEGKIQELEGQCEMLSESMANLPLEPKAPSRTAGPKR